ncbi:8-amino-7-oxononanoate synthase [Maribacter litopenaei]|uniref:8-amino-7-oxononanoate synthase n=1 Tax=Maribacter litopenaei TaxID=2976127 RepID=A0ABY5Y7T1_9FLAO|nr:8-amino-7-oxononanoate synthase [Maribacter litopenaei]UWX54744.1 8-amino-7-oxononanoate synthase [Maribacter litopenaei]
MIDLPKKLKKKLDERASNGALRQLSVPSGLVDFSSNDYLGFARNEILFSKTFQLLLKHNITQNGATGSRLLTGNHSLYHDLELKLAQTHNSENALVFNSGYDANIGFLGSVPQRGDFVFYDEFIHASIRDGLQMSHAKGYKFDHNSLSDLKEKIQKTVSGDGDSEVYIVTESVFSMDGDSPDLKQLVSFCVSEGYRLVVDEAHAVGVMGKKGLGLVQEMGLEKDVFARIVTFGKALGVHGAAVLGSNGLRDYLINFSRSLIYTTALPPHDIIGILSSYEFLAEEGATQRTLLLENIAYFKIQAKKLKAGVSLIDSSSAIQSVIIPGNENVKRISKQLNDDGFNVKAILSPTVPEGKERLRFCIHSFNSKEEIGLIVQLLAKYL